jgi:hypothetical protein
MPAGSPDLLFLHLTNAVAIHASARVKEQQGAI